MNRPVAELLIDLRARAELLCDEAADALEVAQDLVERALAEQDPRAGGEEVAPEVLWFVGRLPAGWYAPSPAGFAGPFRTRREAREASPYHLAWWCCGPGVTVRS